MSLLIGTSQLVCALNFTMLYKNAAARSILRAISSSNAPVARSALAGNVFRARLTSSARYPVRPTSPSLALAADKPVTTALVRYASASAKTGEENAESEPDMMAGMKKDFVCCSTLCPATIGLAGAIAIAIVNVAVNLRNCFF